MLKRLLRPTFSVVLSNAKYVRPASSVGYKRTQTQWIPQKDRILKLQECADLVETQNFQESQKILAQMAHIPASNDGTAIVCALIESALNFRLYELAALCYLRFHDKYSIPNRYLNQLVDGLTRYDPKMTPIHIKTLSKLYEKQPKLRMDSLQKLRLLESSLAVKSKDSRQVFAAFWLAENIPGGVIPDVAINPLIKFFASKDDFGKIVRLWKYLCSRYPDTYLSHTDVVFPLLILFLRKRSYRWLSLEIADACLERAPSDPQYALGVAEAARITNNEELAARLRDKLGENLSRQVTGQLMCLYANKGDYKRMAEMVARMENGRFTAIELGSLVKHYLTVDPDQAFEILDKFAGANKYKTIAYIAVCEHAVTTHNLDMFKSYLARLEAEAGFNANGVCTNLQIKWDSAHETFAVAKRNYQNRRLGGRISSKERKIALNALMDLIIKAGMPDGALTWLESEYQRVNLPLSQLHNRLNARKKKLGKV